MCAYLHPLPAPFCSFSGSWKRRLPCCFFCPPGKLSSTRRSGDMGSWSSLQASRSKGHRGPATAGRRPAGATRHPVPVPLRPTPRTPSPAPAASGSTVPQPAIHSSEQREWGRVPRKVLGGGFNHRRCLAGDPLTPSRRGHSPLASWSSQYPQPNLKLTPFVYAGSVGKGGY